MDTLTIPKAPDVLSLHVDHQWNGTPVAEGCGANIWISLSTSGIVIKAQSTYGSSPRIPDAPERTRIDGLWNYDVVEVFFVGEDGTYTEIELGAGGHWLVFGFSDVRKRSNDYTDFTPQMTYKKLENNQWESEILIPWQMLPKKITRMNAFVINGENFLSLTPLPGTQPDFHQPLHYPSVMLDTNH